MIQLKVKKKDVLTDFLYALFVICYLVTVLVWGMGSSLSQIRYYLLMIATLVAGFNLLLSRNKLNFGKGLLLVVPLGILFLFLSIQRANEVHHEILFRTYVQISLIVLPALYVLFLINLLKLSSLIKMMQFTLICLVIIYFMEPGHRILDFVNISNWAKVSIIHSNSFTESDICSEAFLNLFVFFNFYKNAKGKEINHKNLEVCYRISLIFTILCFKRLAMLFVICIIVLDKIIDWRGHISKYLVPFMSIFFTVATVLYTEFMKGNLFSGFDVYKFTTGRDYILFLWKKLDYISYGYGSSMVLIGRYLEMDLLQIYLELNVFALLVFSFVYFKIAGTNVYSVMIMTYAFFNMLTASSLPGSLSWVIAFITISTVSSDKFEKEEIHIFESKSKMKKLFSKKKGENRIV